MQVVSRRRGIGVSVALAAMLAAGVTAQHPAARAGVVCNGAGSLNTTADLNGHGKLPRADRRGERLEL